MDLGWIRSTSAISSWYLFYLCRWFSFYVYRLFHFSFVLTFDFQLVKPINYDPDSATLAVAKIKKNILLFFYLHTFLGDMNRRKIVKTIETSLAIYYPLNRRSKSEKCEILLYLNRLSTYLYTYPPFFILYVDESIDTYLPIDYYYS